jgi:hypothetical protein
VVAAVAGVSQSSFDLIADAEVGRVSLVPTWRLDVWHWATTDANNLNSG